MSLALLSGRGYSGMRLCGAMAMLSKRRNLRSGGIYVVSVDGKRWCLFTCSPDFRQQGLDNPSTLILHDFVPEELWQRKMVTETAVSPSSEARSQNPNPMVRKPSFSLHEPFVSPEFDARFQSRSSRLDSSVDRSDRGERIQGTFNGNDATSSLRRQEAPLPQAAPLYTVSAAGVSGSLLVAPAAAISDALLLGKGPTVAGPTSNHETPGLKEVHFQPKSHKISLSHEASHQVKAERAPQPPLSSPRDVSPLVAEAICTWGEELGTILGQDERDSISAKPRTGMPRGRPMLTTTGLLPQIMTLR